jgi:hypothetical protein
MVSLSDEDPLVQIPSKAETTEAEAPGIVEEKVLKMLTRIREMLNSDLARRPMPQTFASPLSCDFLLGFCSKPGYHGFTDLRVEAWEDAATEDGSSRRLATTFEVKSVKVQLRDDCGNLLPPELLIATFLHELAHTVTRPEMRPSNSVDAALKKLQPAIQAGARNELIQVHHSESFYANFAELLRVAEQLGIYTLPSAPSKLSPKSLMRFDSIDPRASASGLNMGRSPLFGCYSGAALKPLRIIVTDASKAKRKPLTVETRTVDEILKGAKMRLNLKRKPTVVTTIDGSKVSDGQLVELCDETLLVVL